MGDIVPHCIFYINIVEKPRYKFGTLKCLLNIYSDKGGY